MVILVSNVKTCSYNCKIYYFPLPFKHNYKRFNTNIWVVGLLGRPVEVQQFSIDHLLQGQSVVHSRLTIGPGQLCGSLQCEVIE